MTMENPLSRIKILDLTRLIPGGYCSLLLADMGAQVLKIEDTKRGDYLRWIPPLLDEYGAYFHAINRNKKSLKLDLDTSKGKEIFLKLIARSDVLIEGFRPGVMEKRGLGYKLLNEINPRLVYCAMTGYGQNGPYSNRAGHDINYISVAGILGSMALKDGRPTIPPVQIADLVGSYVATLAILAALFERESTGKGKYLDVSLMEAALSLMTVHLTKSLIRKEKFSGEEEMLSGGLACYNVYETLDHKFISLGALEPKFWKQFVLAVGRDDLVDRQFEIPQAPLKVEVAGIFKTKTRAEWIRSLGEKEVCCEPVYDLHEVAEHQQIASRNLLFKIELSDGTQVDQLRTPVRLSNAPRRDQRPPDYGEHTAEVLKELGYTEAEIRALAEQNII